MKKYLFVLTLISLIFFTSCEKEEVFTNRIDFNGTSVSQITSLWYYSDNDQNILYFSRFVEDGNIDEEDYFYCIIDNALLNSDVDVLNSLEQFEWYFGKDGYSYLSTQGYSSHITRGTFRIDKDGENYYTVVADFATFDSKTISIRWKGYFSYSNFTFAGNR